MNSSRSWLDLSVDWRDNGARLVCSAYTPALPEIVPSNFTVLNVYCKYVVVYLLSIYFNTIIYSPFKYPNIQLNDVTSFNYNQISIKLNNSFSHSMLYNIQLISIINTTLFAFWILKIGQVCIFCNKQ